MYATFYFSLLDRKDMELPPADPALTARLKKLIGPAADRYGMALLDLSDPANPRYGEWQGHQKQNPGSVGKLMVALAIFQALADAHPDDIEARRNVLRTAMITADVFSVYDHRNDALEWMEAQLLAAAGWQDPAEKAALELHEIELFREFVGVQRRLTISCGGDDQLVDRFDTPLLFHELPRQPVE